MSRQYWVPDHKVDGVEGVLDAIDADDELPDVDRSQGRPSEGEISTGAAFALIAEAYTGWSA